MSVIDAGELDPTKKGNAETLIMNIEQKKVSWFSDLTCNIGIIHYGIPGCGVFKGGIHN